MKKTDNNESKDNNTSNLLQNAPKLYALMTIRNWANLEGVCDFRKHPDRLIELITAVRAFGYMDHAIDVGQFCMEYQISVDKFRKWRLKLPELQAAHEEMKQVIHIRRRMRWGGKTFDKDCFLRYAHNYAEEERALDEYHDKRLTQQAESMRDIMKQIVAETLEPFKYPKDKNEK